MTRRVGSTIIIEAETNDVCELCGVVDELRPYGPNGERICYDCGQINPALTEQKIRELFEGAESAMIGKLQ